MTEPSRSRLAMAALAAIVVLYAVVVLRCAWIGDDSFITLRTLDNGLSGHGLRYNLSERVQAYTHPLWLMLLAMPYGLTRDPYGSSLAVGFACSAAAVLGLVTSVAHSRAAAALGVAVLIGSKAAVDYSTSGLENPLTHVLLVVFAVLLGRERPPLVALVGLCSLLALSRPDAVVLAVPAVLWVAATQTPRDWARATAGVIPLLTWALGAFVYYGSVLPNTAYAKLGTGVSDAEHHAQSTHYFLWTATHDPVTLPAIAVGVGVAIIGRDRCSLALMAGALLYLGYVWHIGGDFMAGRFFTAPLWLSVVVLCRHPWPHVAWPAGLATTALAGSLVVPSAPLRSGPQYERVAPSHGVVDERGFYWSGTGLFAPGYGDLPRHRFVHDGLDARGEPVRVKSVIGFYGFYAGSDHHVIDRLGLADPFLARLPAEWSDEWRVGHHRRHVPAGYADSVRSEQPNAVQDLELAAYYDVVREVTRGPILSWHRLGRALALQLGRVDVPATAARFPRVVWLDALPAAAVPVRSEGAGLVVSADVHSMAVELGPGRWTVLVQRADHLDRLELESGAHVIATEGAHHVVFVPRRRASTLSAGGAP